MHSSTDSTSCTELIEKEKGQEQQSAKSPENSEPDRGTCLDVKRLDKVHIPGTRSWELYDASEDYKSGIGAGRYSKYASHVFIVRRKIIPPRYGGNDIPVYDTKFLVWSPWLRSAIEAVLKNVRSIWWGAQPLKVDPLALLAFLPHLKEYLSQIRSNNITNIKLNRENVVRHLEFLINYLESEYASTLQKLDRLLSLRKITFDLLWDIFLPGSTILASCSVTSETRAYRLRDIRQYTDNEGVRFWRLSCEYVEARYHPEAQKTFGWAGVYMRIREFAGTVDINALRAYAIQWHSQPSQIREFLVSRGRKWASTPQVLHAQYNGLAFRSVEEKDNKYQKFNVQGRIMVDRAAFSINDPNYDLPKPSKSLRVPALDSDDFDLDNDAPSSELEDTVESIDDDLLLYASPILYGFDLVSKTWLEFNVRNVGEIRWNDEIFKNLSIDSDEKTVLQSLIEVQAQDKPFDDFVAGKGLGLVINLFGRPGVGKSLTVEAISEHLQRPLYVIGSGDLGTDASTVDQRLRKILALIPTWNAILLIDEADIFLEKRATHDLERNAMVAVFLREIEYFRGVLFLTTNRIKEFDHAFQSRIHLSLHYEDLNAETRLQLWTAFLDKACSNPYGCEEISAHEMAHLAAQSLNGRQIKNVVKVATSLARFEKVPLGYGHLMRTLALTVRFDDYLNSAD